ncbi:MAG TPA: transporter [Candidatus Limnocylindrales bacterium]|nr:transporter [Candidatus Limnocylindrales bacterium]
MAKFRHLTLHLAASVASVILFFSPLVSAQTLAPRAYVVTPVDTNAFTVTTNLYRGDILFDNSVPIEDASGTISLSVPTFYHSLTFFRRSASVTVGLPYALASLRARVVDQQVDTYRSGLGDGAVRFSVNLMGGPAMKLPEFMKWKQKRLLGVSIVVQAPTGQYDPRLLINVGNSRWVIHPELGYSERHGNWLVDIYSGVIFFTKTPEFFSHNNFVPGKQERTQEPVEVVEGHLSYDFKPRLWVSLDGNFWYGGRTTLNGVENRASLQKNSRVGATAAIPITLHQSIKFSYDRGAVIRFGGKYQAVAVAWQYGWIGSLWPK